MNGKMALLEIKTKKRGWVNPANEPENWQGLCEQFHLENQHLIILTAEPRMREILHEIPNTAFRIDGIMPKSVEIR